jgi:hypothetical protein
VGQTKGYSHDIYLRKGELKSSSLLDQKREKEQLAREKAPRIKRKNAVSKLWGVVAEGRGDVDGDEDEENQAC